MDDEFTGLHTTDGGYVVGDYTAPEEPQMDETYNPPTQTEYPWKAVLRTVVAFVLGIATSWVITTNPALEPVLQAAGPALVEGVTNAISAFFVGLYTWIFSRPAVNEFLTKFGLGAKPKYAV